MNIILDYVVRLNQEMTEFLYGGVCGYEGGVMMREENNRSEKVRAPRNQTLTLSPEEEIFYRNKLLRLQQAATVDEIVNRTICGDLLEVVNFLPDAFVDLLILDPPYNLDKDFHGSLFKERDHKQYLAYVETWFSKLIRLLKPTASVYLCGDWNSTAALYLVLDKYMIVRNRITWQREKGRGALRNWKNCSEDIWFATVSDEYTFNVDAVKMKRRVIAPYRKDGQPKDWEETEDGNFRITYPSNFWDDITIPYWSMPENTDHPTQKPEKLIAKLILASSNPGDIVLDPFLGSGTTSVVAAKLGRRYCGIEQNIQYCCWAEKRLDLAREDKSIQGYADGVFWERNTLNLQKRMNNLRKLTKTPAKQAGLFLLESEPR